MKDSNDSPDNLFDPEKFSPTGRYLNAQTPPDIGTVIKTGRVIGRDKVVVAPEDVRRLAELHVPISDMAKFFGVAVDTLTYNFKDIIDVSKEFTKQRIRKKQIEVAMEGSIPMLIWLGKNMLGQQESPPPDNLDENSGEVNINVKRPEKPVQAVKE